MKKIFFKTTIFLAGLFIIIFTIIIIPAKSDAINVFLSSITNSSSYGRNSTNSGSPEILPAIASAQTPSSHTKLVLGDSVCFRLFRNMQDVNDDYLFLGTNQAIGMSGQYLLAKEFIDSHENVTDIYLIMLPLSFNYDFNTTYGYPYAIMPFAETNLLNNLDLQTLESAQNAYGEFFLRKEIVEIIDYSDINRKLYLNSLAKFFIAPEQNQNTISQMTQNNLSQLIDLCQGNGIKLHILPGPLPDTEQKHSFIEEQKQELMN